jgi:hypothetical protein
LDRFSGSKSPPHIFWGLMRVFRHEFTGLAALLVLRVLTNFQGIISSSLPRKHAANLLCIRRPFATQGLLQYASNWQRSPLLTLADRYIETQGKGDDVRPWVWIAMLFLGPVVGTAVTSVNRNQLNAFLLPRSTWIRNLSFHQRK